MSFGYDDELPAGFQDADLETLELEEAAREAEAERKRIAREDAELEAAASPNVGPIGIAGDDYGQTYLAAPPAETDTPTLPGLEPAPEPAPLQFEIGE